MSRTLSIIIPVFNEEGSISRLLRSVSAVVDGMACGTDAEILVIDDGSTDGTREALKAAQQVESRIKIIRFKRNFGQTAAMSAGFAYAEGAIIVSMDGDGQNDPRDIPMLIKKIEEGNDVVCGWRKDRKDALLTRRIPSFFANKLISFIGGVRLKDYGCTLKAYKAEYVKNIKLFGEMHRFIPIYTAWEGAKIVEVPVAHHPRTAGKSNYGLMRTCLLYTSPSPRDGLLSRMPSSA